jgi:hypothetical protein
MTTIPIEENPFAPPSIEICQQPPDRPQFSLAALMKFTTGVCVLLALLTRMTIDAEPMVAGFCIILVSTLVVLKIVDSAAFAEIRDYHAPS